MEPRGLALSAGLRRRAARHTLSAPRLFHEHGLPHSIRTDSGVPFATQAICGLSRLSVRWVKLGIMPDRIEPGKPQQNGQHEPARLGGAGCTGR